MTKSEKTIYIILGIICVVGIVLYIFISHNVISWNGNSNLDSVVSIPVHDSVVQDQQIAESKKDLLFIAQVGKENNAHYLKFSIFDPVDSSILFTRTVYPENNIGNRRYNNGHVYTRFIPATYDVYFTTHGNKVNPPCPPNSYECYGDPVCPATGECIENILWRINMNDSASPEKVYSNIVTSNVYNPKITIPGVGDFVVNEIESYTSPDKRYTLSVKMGTARFSIRDNVSGEVKELSDLHPQNVKIVWDTESKGIFYITKLTPATSSNLYGVSGVRYRNLTTGEDVAVFTGPTQIFSADEKYLVGSSRVEGKHELYLIDITTNERVPVPAVLTENIHGYDLLQLFK